MPVAATLPLDPSERGYALVDDHADTTGSASSLNNAVSWGAIAAGATAGAALSLILLILGVGLGLSSVSPWSSEGISAASFGISTVVWLTFTQLFSSSAGGYLAGRLRTRWVDAHTDEVYFRDTAHGFLAWAVASLVTAGLLTSVIGTILTGGIHAGASVAGGVAMTTAMAPGRIATAGTMPSAGSESMAYFVDSLFRRNGSAEATNPESPGSAGASERTMTNEASEVARIFMNVSHSESLPSTDVQYIGQLVAQRTGQSQQEAEKRVSEVYARAQAKLNNTEAAAKDAADKTRKASAYAALWMFVSLLIGAFVASLAATYGGRQRDA